MLNLKRMMAEIPEPTTKNYKSNCKFSIQNLPDEILIHIFKFLSTFDILKRIALVCKNFYKLSKDKSLFKEIEISDFKQTKEQKYEILERTKDLTKLSLVDCWDVVRLINKAQKSNPKLNYLQIQSHLLKWNFMKIKIHKIYDQPYEGYDRRKFHSDILMSKIEHLENTKHLILKGINLQIFSLQTAQMSKLKNLKTLNLYGSCGFTNEDLINVAENCVNLENLDIRVFNGFGEEQNFKDFSHFSLETLYTKRNRTLKKLYIKNLLGNVMTLKYFDKCQQLEELKFECLFSDDILRYLNPTLRSEIALKAFSKLKKLKILKFGCEYMESADIISIFDNYNLKHLEELGLNYCYSFNENVLKSIRIGCPKLKILNLRGWTFKSLFSGEKINNLSELNLYLDDSSDILSENSENLSDKIIKDIAICCPNLELFSIYRMKSENVTSISLMKNLKILELTFDRFETRKFGEDLPHFKQTVSNHFAKIFSNGDLKSLKKLKFVCNVINDNLIQAIAQNCPNLEKLDIYDKESDISENGCKFLIKNCKNLQFLYLNADNFSNEFLNEIRKQVLTIYLGQNKQLLTSKYIDKLISEGNMEENSDYDEPQFKRVKLKS